MKNTQSIQKHFVVIGFVFLITSTITAPDTPKSERRGSTSSNESDLSAASTVAVDSDEVLRYALGLKKLTQGTMSEEEFKTLSDEVKSKRSTLLEQAKETISEKTKFLSDEQTTAVNRNPQSIDEVNAIDKKLDMLLKQKTALEAFKNAFPKFHEDLLIQLGTKLELEARKDVIKKDVELVNKLITDINNDKDGIAPEIKFKSLKEGENPYDAAGKLFASLKEKKSQYNTDQEGRYTYFKNRRQEISHDDSFFTETNELSNELKKINEVVDPQKGLFLKKHPDLKKQLDILIPSSDPFSKVKHFGRRASLLATDGARKLSEHVTGLISPRPTTPLTESNLDSHKTRIPKDHERKSSVLSDGKPQKTSTIPNTQKKPLPQHPIHAT